MIIIHQKMHKDNFSQITLLKDFPYTYFGKLYCHLQGVIFGLYIDQCTCVNNGYYTIYKIVYKLYNK
jgi:hypothetical protein